MIKRVITILDRILTDVPPSEETFNILSKDLSAMEAYRRWIIYLTDEEIDFLKKFIEDEKTKF